MLLCGTCFCGCPWMYFTLWSKPKYIRKCYRVEHDFVVVLGLYFTFFVLFSHKITCWCPLIFSWIFVLVSLLAVMVCDDKASLTILENATLWYIILWSSCWDCILLLLSLWLWDYMFVSTQFYACLIKCNLISATTFSLSNSNNNIFHSKCTSQLVNDDLSWWQAYSIRALMPNQGVQ